MATVKLDPEAKVLLRYGAAVVIVLAAAAVRLLLQPVMGAVPHIIFYLAVVAASAGPGHGSEFLVTLPLDTQPADPEPLASTPAGVGAERVPSENLTPVLSRDTETAAVRSGDRRTAENQRSTENEGERGT